MLVLNYKIHTPLREAQILAKNGSQKCKNLALLQPAGDFQEEP